MNTPVNTPSKLWFKAKTYGYGWYPVSWQGWLTIIIFIAAVFGNFVRFYRTVPPNQVPVDFLIETGLLVAILILVCVMKGEKAGWRWGIKK